MKTLHCITRLSINGESPVSCMPITQEAALYLNETGSVSREEAEVALQLNVYKELMIHHLGKKNVFLERTGRRRRLCFGHPVRICEDDIIHIEGTSVHLIESTFVSFKPSSSVSGRVFRLCMASSVVCSLVAFSACHKYGEEEKICVNDAQRCIDHDNPHVCKNNAWVRTEECTANQVCVEKSNTQAVCEILQLPAEENTACDEGSQKCYHNSIFVCEQNHWTLSKICKNKTGCSVLEGKADCVDIIYDCERDNCTIPVSMGEGVCTNGQQLCFNNSVYTCTQQRWKLEQSCVSPSYCGYENSKLVCVNAGPCVNGDVVCDNLTFYKGKIYQCKDNKWVLSETCEDAYECVKTSNKAASCVPMPDEGEPVQREECKHADMKCDSGSAVLECDDGSWALKEFCDEDKRCKKAADGKASCVKK